MNFEEPKQKPDDQEPVTPIEESPAPEEVIEPSQKKESSPILTKEEMDNLYTKDPEFWKN